MELPFDVIINPNKQSEVRGLSDQKYMHNTICLLTAPTYKLHSTVNLMHLLCGIMALRKYVDESIIPFTRHNSNIITVIQISSERII